MGHYIKQNQDGYGLLLRDDEIDLFELLGALKKNLWLILAITAAFTTAAILYTYLVTPTYQASATMGKPSQATLNRIDGAVGIYELDPELEYQRLFQTMINQDIRKAFFLENLLSEMPEISTETTRQRQFESFSGKLSVSLKEKGRNVSHDHIQVSYTGSTPEAAYQVLTSFLNYANDRALASLKEDYAAELEFAKRTYQNEIQLLLDAKTRNVSNEIRRLKESAK